MDGKRLVDVADVARGVACNCVCPSCQTRLVARKGERRALHFAHAARKAYDDTQSQCNYSVFVAARSMLKQLVGDCLELRLPAYRDCVRSDPDGFDDIEEWFTVTESRRVVLAEVIVETSFDSTIVDILGVIAGYAFVLYVTYPGRGVPDTLQHPKDLRCGVVEVQLDGIESVFLERHLSGKSYREVLLEFLAEDVSAKRWIFHPGYRRAKSEAQAKLSKRLETHRQRGSLRRPVQPCVSPAEGAPPVDPMADYACVICLATWEAPRKSGPCNCPKCGGLLCARVQPSR